MNRTIPLLVAMTTPLFLPSRAHAITIDTVPVGNAGNVADYTGYGAVAYDYRIGATEVTNAQYAAFLNAKAASDPLGLYNEFMGENVRGGIIRSGMDGGYAYGVKADMGNKPVNLVSVYDSLRFINWLNNGQGDGDTETGAYTLLGGTPTPLNSNAILRSANAVWFLPTDDEWYKAAYYDPTHGVGAEAYWDYPTRSNSVPTAATANSVGDISNPGPSVANHSGQADWNGKIGNVTTVGSAGASSESYYGTSDQAGNVMEWAELLKNGDDPFLHGGDWQLGYSEMSAEHRARFDAASESILRGFRVAAIASVPEPSTLALTAVGIVGLLAIRLRRRKR